MADNQITVRVASEIGAHEAIIREAYKDSVGVWTWSVGLTNSSGHNVERYIDRVQTMEHCLEIYLWALETYATEVRRVFRGHNLSEAEFTAALSFHWNTGGINRATWVKKWVAGDRAGARRSMATSWRKPSSLNARRDKEMALFFDGVWSGDGKITEFKIHRSSHTPNWSSARRVDIRPELSALLNLAAEPFPPNSPPNSPPIKPEPGFWSRFWSWWRD